MLLRQRSRFAPILALSCFSLIATPLFADSMDDLLDLLRTKGVITQQEYDTMKQRLAAQKQQAAAPVQVPAPQFPAAAAPVRMMEKGIGLHVGPVDVSVSGEINGFYDHDRVDKIPSLSLIDGGLASTGATNSSAVRNGLLPGNFSVFINTTQAGYDIGVTFGLYPGLNSVTGTGGANSAGNPQGLATAGIDFRQQFITVHHKGFGTIKIGRDIGMFGSEAILNDITLLGVGSTGGGNIAPSNTSFGRIGLGYIYTDFIPQITYTTPSLAGLSGSIGVFTPLRTVNFTGLSGSLTGHDEPQIQAKLAYSGSAGPFKAKLWTNGITQHLVSNGVTDALPVGHGLQASGIDYGGKLSLGGLDLVAYGYDGWGLGTTGLFFDAVDAAGRKRESHGFYYQAAYTFAKKFTLAASYGLSHLDSAPGEVDPSLVKDNSSEVGQIRYKLTDWFSMIFEYTHTTARPHAGPSINSDSVAGGGFLFFGATQ
jgi:predicted porin